MSQNSRLQKYVTKVYIRKLCSNQRLEGGSNMNLQVCQNEEVSDDWGHESNLALQGILKL